MSRYSPQNVVQDHSADILSNAISSALGTVMANRRYNQQNAERKQDKARAETIQNIGLAKEGVHLTTPGDLPPTFDLNISGGSNPDDLALPPRSIGGDWLEKAGDRANPVLTPPSRPPVTVTPSRSLSFGPGYYVDNDEKARNVATDAKAHLNAMLAEALGKAQIDETVDPGARALKRALTQSEIDKNNADAKKAGRPEEVSYQHLVDPVTGAVSFINPKAPPVGLRLNPVPRPAAEVGGAMKFKADQRNKIIDDFARDTKKFEDVRAGWEVLNGAIKEPSLATPFALADAYARISNPGAVVRPTTMQMIEELGSLDQRVRKYAEHNLHGQLPPDITRDLVRTISSMVKEHADTYNQQRSMALTRGRQEGITDLDPIIPTFTYTDPFAPTPPSANGRIQPQRGNAPTGNVDFRTPTSPPSYEQWKASKGIK